MIVNLSWEQRLIVERVINGQRASIIEMRQWQKLAELIGLSDEDRAAAGEIALLRMSGAGEASFEPQHFNPQEFEMVESDIDRLARALKTWSQYLTSDYRTYALILEALGKPDVAPKAYPAGFDFEIDLLARLQLLLFLKQQANPPDVARKLYALAKKFSLEKNEIEAIRYTHTANGGCQWNRERIAGYSERRTICLTDLELSDLTERLSAHEGWSPQDVVWLESVLAALGEPVAPEKPATLS